MTPEKITDILRHTLFVALEMSTPFLLLSLCVGILVSLFQSVTKIHEMTLSFVPKMVIVAIALTLFFPWMMKILIKFTNALLVDEWRCLVESNL